MTEATLLYLIKDEQVLLLEKQRKIGSGKLNGVGGKREPSDNSIIDTMLRECKEEINVTPTNYQKVADIKFLNPSDDETERKMHVHVFLAFEWDGEPSATNEMKKPQWHDFDKLPFEQMLPDDKHWLPEVLAGKLIKANFSFDDNWNIIENDVYEVERFED